MNNEQKKLGGGIGAVAAFLTLFACAFAILSHHDGSQPPSAPVDVPVLKPHEIHVTPDDNGGFHVIIKDEHGDEEKLPTGYTPNPEGTQRFLRTLDKPTIREAGPELFRAVPGADKKGVFLYRPLLKQYQTKFGKPWIVGKQAIGDCVSWGWMHGVAICCAVECEIGQSAEFDVPATEAIYGGSRVEASGSPGDGSRPYGGWGDGSYGGAAAKWVHGYGILWRREYPFADLRVYSGQRAKEWGAYGCGGKGDGGKADHAAQEFPVGSVALVRTFDEAAAAIRSGYPVPVCSNQGFSSKRDADGFARASGSWSHCFPAGTLVMMGDGKSQRRIEKLRVGDTIRSHLGNACKVLRTFNRAYSGNMVTLRCGDGRFVRSTADHKFWIHGDWCAAQDLRVGDELSLSYWDFFNQAVVTKQEKILRFKQESAEPGLTVYCLEVEKDHSFIANGYSVHNCMCFIGARIEPRPGLLCLNSWGPAWISGPKFPADQPDGSFWVEKSVADRMLRGEDSFAVSGLRGFPFRDLSNGDWVRVEPRSTPNSETQFALSP